LSIAFFGTGLMGEPMASHFLKAGHKLTAWNRTVDKVEALTKLGAAIAKTPTDAMKGVDCVMIMLADYNVIQQVFLTDEMKKALAEQAKSKMLTVINFATIAPFQSLTFKEELEKLNVQFLEAPVLGTRIPAEQAKLQVFLGGKKELAEKFTPIVSVLGRVRYLGEVGFATTLKMAVNETVCTQTALFALAVGMAQKKGIDLDVFMDVLRHGPSSCPYFDLKFPVMKDRNYDQVLFATRLAVKDAHLISETAKSLDLDSSLPDCLEKLFKRAVDAGLGEKDFASVYEVVNPPPQKSDRVR